MVNYILKQTEADYTVAITWYRTDDVTGKIVSLNEDSEMNIKKINPEWIPLEDSVTDKVMRHWRQN